MKKIKAEEARAREQRRNSPRVYKRKKGEEEPLELNEMQSKMMKRFARAITQEKWKHD